MSKPQQSKPEEKGEEIEREPIPFDEVARRLLAAKPAPKLTQGPKRPLKRRP